MLNQIQIFRFFRKKKKNAICPSYHRCNFSLKFFKKLLCIIARFTP